MLYKYKELCDNTTSVSCITSYKSYYHSKNISQYNIFKYNKYICGRSINLLNSDYDFLSKCSDIILYSKDKFCIYNSYIFQIANWLYILKNYTKYINTDFVCIHGCSYNCGIKNPSQLFDDNTIHLLNYGDKIDWIPECIPFFDKYYKTYNVIDTLNRIHGFTSIAILLHRNLCTELYNNIFDMDFIEKIQDFTCKCGYGPCITHHIYLLFIKYKIITTFKYQIDLTRNNGINGCRELHNVCS